MSEIKDGGSAMTTDEIIQKERQQIADWIMAKLKDGSVNSMAGPALWEIAQHIETGLYLEQQQRERL